MSASLSAGLGRDPDGEARILMELVERRLVDTVRSFSDGVLVEVSRRDGAVHVEKLAADWLVEDQRKFGRGASLSYEEWDRWFGGCHLVVPALRVAQRRFTFKAEAELARAFFESESIELRRLDETLRFASDGARRDPQLFGPINDLLSFCHRRELVACFHM